ALGHSGAPQLQLRPEHAAQSPYAPALPGVLASGQYPNRWQPDTVRLNDDTVRPKTDTTDDGASADRPATDGVSGVSRTGAAAIEIRPMIPLGQFRDTFIIAVDDEGVAIIDQHVAHERVLFERVMERLS